MNAKKCYCIIDTMQIRVNHKYFNDPYILEKENFEFIKFLRDEVKEEETYKVLKVNLNKMNGYDKVNSIQEHYEKLEVVCRLLGIQSMECIELNRIDIAIDCDLDFVENFKFLYFIFDASVGEKQNADNWHNTKKNKEKGTMDEAVIILKDRTIDVCFYDKSIESNGRHPYRSRLEWRFKRVSDTKYENHLDRLVEKLKDMENNTKYVEEVMTKILINRWNRDKIKYMSFSEFIRTNDNLCYTLNVVREVYKQSGLNGSFKNWYKTFNKSEVNKLVKFYTKKDITEFKKEMIKSIKIYKKK